MDLATLATQLGKLDTFASNLADFLWKPIEIITKLGLAFGDLDKDGKSGLAESFETTSSALKKK